MSIKKGCYVVVEGLEGAGKTTAMKTVKRFLAQAEISFTTTREPGATVVGEKIREILKNPAIKDSLNPRTELLLFYAARVELLEQIIKPSLAKGDWVVSDRFELSSYAYQGGGRKLDLDVFHALSGFCMQNLKPDLLIFLDISPEVGLERARRRGTLDRIEQEPLEFFRDVYDAYHKHLSNYPNVVSIDASLPLAVVQRLIKEKLEEAVSSYA